MRKTIVIAEIGVNHNGCVETAKHMIDAAKSAGADYVKFQTFVPSDIVSQHAEKALYQKTTTNSEESQLDMLKALQLSFEDLGTLKHYCIENKIGFLSSPFDSKSISFLETLGMEYWKIPSGEVTNYPYLVHISKVAKNIILSTGMSTLEEVAQAIKILKRNFDKKIYLLHCTSEYPAPFDSVNLRAMETLKNEFHLEVGYSDHTLGIEVPLAAVSLGACIIEKHFTLDCNMKGPDHKASIEPETFHLMVTSIRNIETSMGNGIKAPAYAENKNKPIVRRSIVAKKPISKGDFFTEENLICKRPGHGISPMRWPDIIGTQSHRDFDEDELIEL